MRDTRCMNDYSEVAHGYQRLRDYFHGEGNRDGFYAVVNACASGVGEEAIKLFDQWSAHLFSNTYIACLSEHGDEDEDLYGRLSMWRAYGPGSPGVAIVLRLPFEQRPESPWVFLSPVAYFSSIASEMARILENVRRNQEFLESIPRPMLVTTIHLMLVMAAVSLKHPAFHEEREWRIIHLPLQYPSKFVPSSAESIRGVPQLVYKILLKDVPEEGVIGIEPSKLIDRVIIGPSAFPGPMAAAFANALTEAGIENAASKVFASNVPLRS